MDKSRVVCRINTGLRRLSLILSLALLVTGFALADPILNFNIPGPQGAPASVSYAGGATPLIGSDIAVDTVTGLGTPLNNLVARNCISCLLSFTTGAFTGSTPTTWSFGGGGLISLIGGIDLNNNGFIDPGDVPLASPILTGFFVGPQLVTAIGATLRTLTAKFQDTKDGTLAAFYGLSGAATFSGNMVLSFNSAGLPPGAFSSSSVLASPLLNTAVPEPGSMLLLGTGLILLGGAARHRLFSRS